MTPALLAAQAGPFTAALPQGKPLPPLDTWRPLLVAGGLCLLLALGLAALIVVLSKPRKAAPTPQAKHVTAPSKERWHTRIDQVVTDHAQGRIDQSQAMSQLAEIVRAFASEASGQDLTARTLAELSRQPRTRSNRRQLDLLRQTIAALYPPEFADPSVNRQAYEAQVPQAAQWASALVEGWR
ncbi:hypothetical protein BACT_0975 [Bifidobacterium actinocoloniiforme DSM 22766]|uniref:Uncharacterized protein n=1 Tax=Bifidobacterium actinocoloniiforme DSM 22766 TaxID=1437605 RepID=A0A086Z173_9BIFI|nr:hypothetical protein [Bifidobacterium actinocoloniiforme]AKV55437.1 hypothetical protein AB656_03485 [Bifidobacterium actinocoloniiforme DSM 22766]KFI40273.1 hypothetical protein BACT_0975 [Bifidobacterium actinocoloniiforme DSM 22766]